MDGVLADLGGKVAERWLPTLILPGALYLATATAANVLGHGHALDLPRFAGQIIHWANDPAVGSAGGQVVLVIAALTSAAIAGLTAQALGVLLKRLSLAADWRDWPVPLRGVADSRTRRRRRRWDAAARAYDDEREAAARALSLGDRQDPSRRDAARRTMTRIATERPARPTWSGDRIQAVATTLERDQHIDLAIVWPYLWLTFPESTRDEITEAGQGISRACTLGAWALLYLAAAAWWWPALLIACLLALTSRFRLRAAADVYALLLSAATRRHTADLAMGLGIEHRGPLTQDLGDTLTNLLRPASRPPAGG